MHWLVLPGLFKVFMRWHLWGCFFKLSRFFLTTIDSDGTLYLALGLVHVLSVACYMETAAKF